MKNNNDLSRRQFLLSSGALSGSTFIRVAAPSLAAIVQVACTAKSGGAAFEVLSESEAADITAIAARIIPTTDTPGATEAGVIYFFDSALTAAMSDKLDVVREGLAQLNADAVGVDSFSELAPDDQDEQLRAIESSAFFQLMREMTIYGFFAMSEYGGNKDHVGWNLIGFEGHHGGWQYPFGYYDAQVHRGADDGE